MRIAIISDIHGNLEALQAVLKEIENQKVDRVNCLGDVIGYGCNPVACLDLVNQHCSAKLMGNHEYAAIGLLPLEAMNLAAQQSIQWTIAQLKDRELAMIADFEMKTEDAGSLMVHASPEEPDEWHYVLSQQEAIKGFAHLDQKLAFHGHTHLPLIFCQAPNGNVRTIVGHDFDPDEESSYLINVGSVGQPRDNDPRASFVVYDVGEMSISYHRVEYDFKITQAKMCKADMPSMLIDRLEVGR